MRALIRWVSLVLVVSVLADCKKSQPPSGGEGAPAKEEHKDEPGHEPLPRTVRLTPKVIEAAKLRVEPAARQILTAVIELPGELAADPDKIAKVASPIAGRLEKVEFREGSTVKRGDVLAIVRVPEFGKAKADFAATQARAAAARTNADRLQELAQRGLAANQELLSAKAEAEALEAQARAAGELLRAMGSGGDNVNSQLALRAPISGVAIGRDAVVGQPVSTEQIIATIADLSEVWFLGRVFEKDLGRLRTGAATEVRLNAFPDQAFEGTVDYIGKQIDPVARTLTARIRVKNRDDLLRLGLFGTARVAVESAQPKTPVLVVPQSAVTEIGGKSVVFVREPDGDFEVHDVVLGEAALGKIQIVSGLREGEPVVVEGVFTVKSVLLKPTFGEEGE